MFELGFSAAGDAAMAVEGPMVLAADTLLNMASGNNLAGRVLPVPTDGSQAWTGNYVSDGSTGVYGASAVNAVTAANLGQSSYAVQVTMTQGTTVRGAMLVARFINGNSRIIAGFDAGAGHWFIALGAMEVKASNASLAAPLPGDILVARLTVRDNGDNTTTASLHVNGRLAVGPIVITEPVQSAGKAGFATLNITGPNSVKFSNFRVEAIT